MSSKQLTRKVKDNHGNTHEVYEWRMLKNGWEFYQLDETEEFGVKFGFIDGCPYPEFGSQHEAELEVVTAARAERFDLWELAPPQGWEWLEKEN